MIATIKHRQPHTVLSKADILKAMTQNALDEYNEDGKIGSESLNKFIRNIFSVLESFDSITQTLTNIMELFMAEKVVQQIFIIAINENRMDILDWTLRTHKHPSKEMIYSKYPTTMTIRESYFAEALGWGTIETIDEYLSVVDILQQHNYISDDIVDMYIAHVLHNDSDQFDQYVLYITNRASDPQKAVEYALKIMMGDGHTDEVDFKSFKLLYTTYTYSDKVLCEMIISVIERFEWSEVWDTVSFCDEEIVDCIKTIVESSQRDGARKLIACQKNRLTPKQLKWVMKM